MKLQHWLVMVLVFVAGYYFAGYKPGLLPKLPGMG